MAEVSAAEPLGDAEVIHLGSAAATVGALGDVENGGVGGPGELISQVATTGRDADVGGVSSHLKCEFVHIKSLMSEAVVHGKSS